MKQLSCFHFSCYFCEFNSGKTLLSTEIKNNKNIIEVSQKHTHPLRNFKN